jgi:GT2 family glycosyltransferase
MDDDHEFPEGHLQACLQAISLDPEAVWTIGEYYPFEHFRPLPAPIPGQLHPRGYSYIPKTQDHYFGISCGASIYPRSVVDKYILNLETYPFGILYLEYGARLVRHGYQVRFLDTTYVIHHCNETAGTNAENNELACLFTMFMFSFRHQKSFSNQVKSLSQIAVDLLRRKYSISLVAKAYKDFLKESALLV